MNINDVKNSLKDLYEIEDNWDGYGGIKPNEIILEKTETFLKEKLTTIELDKLTDIYPNPNGTISLDFKRDIHRMISLEIGMDKISYYFRLDSEKTNYNDHSDIDDIKLIEDIKEL